MVACAVGWRGGGFNGGSRDTGLGGGAFVAKTPKGPTGESGRSGIFARTADLVVNRSGPAADKLPDGLAAPGVGG